MAITLETIIVGVENQATGSDSLFTAFTKTQNNFATLANTASPYNTFNGGAGIETETFSSNGAVTITNSGVLNILAGTGITTTSSNGNVTLSVSGSANGTLVAGVTNVGISSNTLTISNSPVISNGVMGVELTEVDSVVPGSYVAPTITIDAYGRITEITDTESTGTVTSVSITAGDGLEVEGGPITSSGAISIRNTGVTRLNAGPGIILSGHTGELTVSSSNPAAGTVSSIEVTSNTLVVTGSPITSTGTINIELPESDTMTGNFTAGNITSSANLVSLGNANIVGTFKVSGESTLSANLLVSANANVTGNLTIGSNANITGTLTVSANANITGNIVASYILGNGSSLHHLTGSNVTGQVGNALVAGTVYTEAQPNITSVGTLVNLSVTGNCNVSANTSSNNSTVTRNLTVGNSTQGNISSFDINASNTIAVANTGYFILKTVSDNTKFVALQAPTSISSSYIVWALPSVDGPAANTSFMSTNGSGQLSFNQPASSSAPTTSSSVGIAGQIAYDTTHIYVCIATNTWIRADAASW